MTHPFANRVDTVFVVVSNVGYGYNDFEGVFATKEAAEAYVDEIVSQPFSTPRENFRVTEEDVQ